MVKGRAMGVSIPRKDEILRIVSRLKTKRELEDLIRKRVITQTEWNEVVNVVKMGSVTDRNIMYRYERLPMK